MITLSPGMAGFLKQILMVVVIALVSYGADAAHLTGILNPTLAVLVSSLLSGLESSMKANSSGTTALFGTIKIKTGQA